MSGDFDSPRRVNASHSVREFAGRLALLLAGLTIGFAFSEALARLLFSPQRVVFLRSPDPVARGQSDMTHELNAGPPGGRLFIETRAGLRLQRNMHVTVYDDAVSHRRIELTTNSLGYRNPELGPKKATRILFLGDSITMASYLEAEETFVRLVERLGRERGHDWEAVNGGVAAIGTADELAILRETGLSVSPDVVVLDWFLNDFEASRAVHVRPLPPRLGWSYLLGQLNAALTQWAGLRQQPTRLPLHRLREEFLRSHPTGRGDPLKDHAAFNAQVVKRFNNWGGAWHPATWDYMRPLLAHFQQLAAQNGFRLLFVAFPVRMQVEAEFVDDYPQQRLAEVARELRVPLLDLLPALRQRYRASAEPLFYDHCHHTPSGSRLVAEQLVTFLEASR